jgi:transposase InsO family protein
MLWVSKLKPWREDRMDLHQNARTCPASRALMVKRVEHEGWSVKQAAEAAGVSVRTVYRWLRRYRADPQARLLDRSSCPYRLPRRTSQEKLAQIRALRAARISGSEISSRLGVPRATVGRWLSRWGLGRLPALAPPEPVRRYQKEHAGELLHLDVKKLGRICGIGHRITGDRRHQRRGIGWEYTHVAIDDASCLSYVEVLEDERGPTAAAFLERAVRWFADHGIAVRKVLTDNGSCYVSRPFGELCLRLGLRHSRTRPYRPRTNGKAERFIQTLLREWAYAFAFDSSKARTTLLDRYLHFYNHHRAHSALAGQSPFAWLSLTNVVRINN